MTVRNVGHGFGMRVGSAAAAVVLWAGCGPSADSPCSPACGAGFVCYYGVCVPGLDASAPPDARDDGGDEDGGGDDGDMPPTGKLDLLFVVDDSGDMGEAQRVLAAAFPSLLDALFAPPTGPGGDPEYPPVEDLHVGVLSSDMGTGTFRVPSCDHSDDGRLQHEPAAGLPDCATGYPAFLTATSAGGSTAHDFECIATLGTNGCGFEQPLAAMERALTVHMAPGGADAAFLRADARLAVVVVSTENDCSTDDPSVFNPDEPPPLPVRCVQLAERLIPVTRFVTALEEAKPSGAFAAAFVVGVPPSLAVCNTTGDRIAMCLDDASMQERIGSTGQVEIVCEEGDVRATPGVRHVELARQLGRRAIVRSICDPQYETFFGSFAELVQTGR